MILFPPLRLLTMASPGAQRARSQRAGARVTRLISFTLLTESHGFEPDMSGGLFQLARAPGHLDV